MSSDIQTVAALLQATLDPRQHKQAEAALKVEQAKPGFSLLLLNIVAANNLPVNTRLSGALCFKNFIKYNYVDEERNYKLPQNEYTSSAGEAISIIAESDFWDRWDTLVDDLVSRLTPDNAKINNGVLEVAHSIFKRWRPLFASDALYTEVNHVLSKFGQPFVQLLASTDQQIQANKDNKEISLLSSRDNIEDLSKLLHKYLTYENPLLATDDDSESGPLEFVKAGICEVSTLYMQKYEDAFGRLCEPFITSAWSLLTTIGPETKFDILVSKALHFLTAVASLDKHAQNFNNGDILSQVVEKVILPNVSLRETDIEQFEDEPIEYIRRDLEGSDADTRRRAATDFLRKLLEKFEPLVTENTAVYLFSAIAAKGVITAGQGVKTTNPLVNVVDFFQQNIANDLLAESNVEPILKVDAIKFLYTFRSQLTKDQWKAAFEPLVKNLGSSNYVVYTYAAITVERVLFLTNDANQHIFGKEDVLPLAESLLNHLFHLIEKDAAPEKIQENEFLMRCVMRVLIVIKDGVIPIADNVLQHLIKITQVIGQNPSNPRFYYYHFEAFGALIRWSAPSQPDKLENDLYPTFAGILSSDVQANNQLEPILGIFQKLMAGKSRTELQSFDVLEALIISCNVSAIEQYFPTILNIMFTRLNNNPPEAFKRRFSDAVQETVFVPLYLTIILPTTQQFPRPLDRKIAVISLTKTLTDSQAFAVKYKKGWSKTCEALLKLLENPPLPVTTDDVVAEADVDDLSFGVGFTQLNTCKKVADDEWPEITDVKLWVGSYLRDANARHDRAISGFVNERLNSEARSLLVEYMQ
ncbi:hypothetical protein DID88_008275 [Monilinia fructigena]|uniref:Importin N-terminal domain-containing protein n=1 Tax=Monilinia fructigena TaxID=38457 RepID=A0A395J4Y2_9HELO|nr:hypothetical protein DID88_008275 [Monilinia fructigena]